MGDQDAGRTVRRSDGSLIRIDRSHDRVAAGTHGLLQARRLKKVLPQLATMVHARTQNCDDTVKAVSGIEQLVLLGAGLDMRPVRLADHLSGVTVFELDLPVMLAERQQAIERWEKELGTVAKAPERHQISVDFLVDDVGNRLNEHFAFSDTALTLVIYEGCSMYFDEQQNQRILIAVRKRLTHPESRLWMDYVTPAVISSAVKACLWCQHKRSRCLAAWLKLGAVTKPISRSRYQSLMASFA